MTANKSN